MAERERQSEITETAAHLRLAIARTARRLRQESMSQEDSGELTPTLMAALATVERCGPVTPSEVAELEGVRRPTATRVLARLEQEGLIERAADPADGRSSLVSTTESGRRYLSRARSRKDALLARNMANLPAEDIAVLERAASILEAMLEAPPAKADATAAKGGEGT